METIMAVLLVWVVVSVPVSIVFGAFLSLGSRTSENATMVSVPMRRRVDRSARRGA